MTIEQIRAYNRHIQKKAAKKAQEASMRARQPHSDPIHKPVDEGEDITKRPTEPKPSGATDGGKEVKADAGKAQKPATA